MTKRSRLSSRNNYVFQQDRAPSHTSRVTQAHLEEATTEFTKKDECPPQSPNCNPKDYVMGLSEGESLPGSERQTDQAGIK